jgi:hypothetical protein
MSIAWTTIIIIALLLPGVFTFIGYSTTERFSRDIIKTSAVGEIGVAVLIAIIVHLIAWGILVLCGFSLADFIRPFIDHEALPASTIANLVVQRLAPVAIYVVVTAFAGAIVGWLIATAVIRGALPRLGKHKWIYAVMNASRDGIVTAYVVTTTAANNRVLMYRGVLKEFYLTLDGNLTYVVLASCSRFFMTFDDKKPMLGEQMPLFGQDQPERDTQFWDYLFIDGKNIANILVDPSQQINATPQGTKRLDEALERDSEELETDA